MADFFSNLFSTGQTGNLAGDPAKPVNMPKPTVNEQLRIWQIQWHDLFDEDQTLIEAGEFERPAPIPERHDLDFRLIFGLLRAEPATREACFALFPKGAEMAARFERWRDTPPAPLSEAEARDGIETLSRIIPPLGPHKDVNFGQITVIDRDTPEGMEALCRTDNLTYVLENTSVDPYNSKDTEARAALIFLAEPLYAACGNYNHLRDWVTAAMYEPGWDAVQDVLFHLWAGGWQVALDESDAIVLAHRRLTPDAG